MKILIEGSETPKYKFPALRVGINSGATYVFASKETLGVRLVEVTAKTSGQASWEETMPFVGKVTLTQE